MKNALIKLLKVKSLVTISVNAVVLYVVMSTGDIPDSLLTIFTTIIGFYFGTQANKKEY